MACLRLNKLQILTFISAPECKQKPIKGPLQPRVTEERKLYCDKYRHVGDLETKANDSINARTSLRFLYCEAVNKWNKIDLTSFRGLDRRPCGCLVWLGSRH
jgi:hypothetical protein